MQVLGRATGPELGQQVHAACAGPVLIPIACAQPYLGRPVPGEDEDRHRRSSFNRRGGERDLIREKRRECVCVSRDSRYSLLSVLCVG